MTTVLIGLLVLVAILVTIRILRTIPWIATIRLAAIPVIAIAAVYLLVHHQINPHDLIGHIVPDFGGTP